ncbi:MAG TPA: hypothetical protein VJB67_03590 [Patescibacteria group bacterium]|nr:hypothetical protein [Patescibacteria group bacterium]
MKRNLIIAMSVVMASAGCPVPETILEGNGLVVVPGVFISSNESSGEPWDMIYDALEQEVDHYICVLYDPISGETKDWFFADKEEETIHEVEAGKYLIELWAEDHHVAAQTLFVGDAGNQTIHNGDTIYVNPQMEVDRKVYRFGVRLNRRYFPGSESVARVEAVDSNGIKIVYPATHFIYQIGSFTNQSGVQPIYDHHFEISLLKDFNLDGRQYSLVVDIDGHSEESIDLDFNIIDLMENHIHTPMGTTPIMEVELVYS